MWVFGYDSRMAGTFTATNIDTKAGHGVYLEFPVGANMPQGMQDSVIVTGVNFNEKEKYYIVDCFNDIAHTYSFGHDPSSSLITVNFLGFLATSCSESGTNNSFGYDSLDSALGHYAANRLSKQSNPVKLHMGGLLFPGFLISLRSGTANVDYNLQNYSMDLLSVEVIESKS